MERKAEKLNRKRRSAGGSRGTKFGRRSGAFFASFAIFARTCSRDRVSRRGRQGRKAELKTWLARKLSRLFVSLRFLRELIQRWIRVEDAKDTRRFLNCEFIKVIDESLNVASEGLASKVYQKSVLQVGQFQIG